MVESLKIYPEAKNIDGVSFLFDRQIASDYPLTELFSYDTILTAGLITGSARGRNDACFFSWKNHDLVLKHFSRGGLIAKLFKDTYFGFRPNKTRSWLEWQLLCDLYQHDFPVPRPVVARASVKSGFYRADLITVRIPDSSTLADVIKKHPVSRSLWHEIGTCIRSFHNYGLYHADLNANNILIDSSGHVFLIDFDRCKILRSTGWWKKNNLKRLHRSLIKIKTNTPSLYFEEKDWIQLQMGYSASL